MLEFDLKLNPKKIPFKALDLPNMFVGISHLNSELNLVGFESGYRPIVQVLI